MPDSGSRSGQGAPEVVADDTTGGVLGVEPEGHECAYRAQADGLKTDVERLERHARALRRAARRTSVRLRA